MANTKKLSHPSQRKTVWLFITTILLFISGLIVTHLYNEPIPSTINLSLHIIIIMLSLQISSIAVLRFIAMRLRLDLLLAIAYGMVLTISTIQFISFVLESNLALTWSAAVERLLLSVMLYIIFAFSANTREAVLSKKDFHPKNTVFVVVGITTIVIVASLILVGVSKNVVFIVADLCAFILLLITFIAMINSKRVMRNDLGSYIAISVFLLLLSQVVYVFKSDGDDTMLFFTECVEIGSYLIISFGLLSNIIQAYKDQLSSKQLLLHKNHELALVDKQKDEFVGFVSHQLKGPLTTVKWRLDFIKEHGRLNPAQVDDVDTIGRSNQRLIDMAKMFLNVTRLNFNRYEPEIENFNIKNTIYTLLDEQGALIRAKNLKINVSCNNDLFVDYDRVAFTSIIDNLLSNAAKYSNPEGQIGIVCDIKDSSIYITVKDNGIGIPQESKSAIFKPFTRLSNANKASTVGSGYGLYFIHKLIANLGGIITLESVVDVGTTFNVLLPIKISVQKGDK